MKLIEIPGSLRVGSGHYRKNLPIQFKICQPSLFPKLFLQAVVNCPFTLSFYLVQVKQIPHEEYQGSERESTIFLFNFCIMVIDSWFLASYLEPHLTMECLTSQDTTFLFPRFYATHTQLSLAQLPQHHLLWCLHYGVLHENPTDGRPASEAYPWRKRPHLPTPVQLSSQPAVLKCFSDSSSWSEPPDCCLG